MACVGSQIIRSVNREKPSGNLTTAAACIFAGFSPSFAERPTPRGTTKMATLTKRQKQLIDYLNNYISDHGYAPTFAEESAYFGLSSLATVHKHLHNPQRE